MGAVPTSISNSFVIMNQKNTSTNLNPAPDEDRGISKAAGTHLFYIAIPVLLSLVVYVNSLSNGFVYDDYATIIDNKHIGNLLKSLPSLFDRSYFNIASGEASYRPVATLSDYLIYAVEKLAQNTRNSFHSLVISCRTTRRHLVPPVQRFAACRQCDPGLPAGSCDCQKSL